MNFRWSTDCRKYGHAGLVGQVREVAQNPKTTVLLLGETGTGKEFIARVLHYNGQRAAAPFIGINCTGIPRELFESELFGYAAGRLHRAHHRKFGVLDRAEGGTLFLDEIGDLDLAMQAKLLRVLQERKFQRVGGTEEISARLSVDRCDESGSEERNRQRYVPGGSLFPFERVSFELPPLRSRVEDIFPLSIKALMRSVRNLGKISWRSMPMPADSRTRCLPGNIRELQNIMERATIFCQGKTLTTVAFRASCKNPAHRLSWLPPREISGLSVSHDAWQTNPGRCRSRNY